MIPYDQHLVIAAVPYAPLIELQIVIMVYASCPVAASRLPYR